MLSFFIATKQGGNGAMKCSGLRAPLDIDLCREWEITFQIVLIHYLNYNSEKY